MCVPITFHVPDGQAPGSRKGLFRGRLVGFYVMILLFFYSSSFSEIKIIDEWQKTYFTGQGRV